VIDSVTEWRVRGGPLEGGLDVGGAAEARFDALARTIEPLREAR
jgi:hypothetical protein